MVHLFENIIAHTEIISDQADFNIHSMLMYVGIS